MCTQHFNIWPMPLNQSSESRTDSFELIHCDYIPSVLNIPMTSRLEVREEALMFWLHKKQLEAQLETRSAESVTAPACPLAFSRMTSANPRGLQSAVNQACPSGPQLTLVYVLRASGSVPNTQRCWWRPRHLRQQILRLQRRFRPNQRAKPTQAKTSRSEPNLTGTRERGFGKSTQNNKQTAVSVLKTTDEAQSSDWDSKTELHRYCWPWKSRKHSFPRLLIITLFQWSLKVKEECA